MKNTISVLLLIFSFFISCEKLGEIIDEGKYEKPVIEKVDAFPGNVNQGDTVTAVVVATNPEDGMLTYSWSSDPSRGTFIQPANLDTVYWIAPSVGDTYTLKVTVRNDEESNTGEDIVVVRSYEKPIIEKVDVFPGTVNPGDTVTAIVVATNPEDGLLTYSWSSDPNRGQFIQPANKDTVYWIAPLIGDTYTLKVTVRNEKSNTGQDVVIVQSSVNPLVNITSPKTNEFFVQNTNIDVELTAYHDNSLAYVRLFVNGIQKGEQNYDASNNYLFSFTTDSSMVGPTTIEVVAAAFNKPDNTGSDLVVVNVEGILPKSGGN
ncbi:MAG: hypothetical protein D8M58_03240 [Calditrichaeota bacterium]|nr:MAG: hypothetical protein DWQ03_03840 [Calditrichota bacterium]MBL1204381.1 hypothetical protein [Calditrichota bacterium]NOG44210.1 Ig-like domain-containing protein [Calditrichota bacterium]